MNMLKDKKNILVKLTSLEKSQMILKSININLNEKSDIFSDSTHLSK